MKGISAIISLMLILMITISIAGLAYTFFFRITTTTTNIAETRIKNVSSSFLARMKIESMSTNSIYVRNMGQSDMSGIAVLINDVVSNVNVTPSVIKAGGVGTIKILDFLEKDDDIKIFSTQGTSANLKAPDPCEQATLCLNFDEGLGKTAEDNSGNGNDGIFDGESFNDGIINGAIRVSGKYGTALNFDGNDDNVDISDTGSLSIPEYLTISAWINIKGNNSDVGASYRRQIVRKENSYLLRIQNSSTVNNLLIGYIHNTTDWKSCQSSTALNYNRWYFVAMTYNNSDKVMRLYINGSLDKSCTLSPAPKISTNNNHVYIGYITGQYSFNGTIDEVRIWNRTLTLQEVQADMQSSTPMKRTMASYNFEESGSYANDTHIWVQGKYGKALSFDGSDDRMKIADSNNLNTGNYFTFEGVYLFSGIKTGDNYFYNRNMQTYGDGFHVIYASTLDYKIHYQYANGVSYIDKSSNALVWNLNQWYFVAVTHDIPNKIINFYRDGQNIGTVTYSDDAMTVDSGDAYFGGHQGDNRFNGIIDDVRIYNRIIY